MEISKKKNKKIRIPRYYLDDIGDALKNRTTVRKKLGYIKRIILKKKTKMELYDLIYFILYKPETLRNILKFLVKEKIISSEVLMAKNNANAKNLVLNFEKFLNSKLLSSVLETEEIIIKNRVLKNEMFILNMKDRYYRGIYDKTFVLCDKKRYYFLGKKGAYFVSINNELNGKKNQILEEVCQVKGLINKI